MKKIAIILAAFNRKEKTIECLKRLFAQDTHGIIFTVYLTDDASTDGTSEAVEALFPDVIISHGNGKLFWAGGMNLSWKRAVRDGGYDGYLWLNDDTFLFDNVWHELIDADEFCQSKYYKRGIYVGSTLSMDRSILTYGGSRSISRWRSKYELIHPNGAFQECVIANGNVTYISKEVVDKLGCFYPGYIHGADYDYTYWAHKENFPILILRSFVGLCDNDHPKLRDSLIKRSFKERIRFLYAPTGMQLPTALLFQKRFYPHYVPLLFVSYWFKALFPWILKK